MVIHCLTYSGACATAHNAYALTGQTTGVGLSHPDQIAPGGGGGEASRSFAGVVPERHPTATQSLPTACDQPATFRAAATGNGRLRRQSASRVRVSQGQATRAQALSLTPQLGQKKAHAPSDRSPACRFGYIGPDVSPELIRDLLRGFYRTRDAAIVCRADLASSGASLSERVAMASVLADIEAAIENAKNRLRRIARRGGRGVTP